MTRAPRRCLLAIGLALLAAPVAAQQADPDLYQQARLEMVKRNLDSAIVLFAEFRRVDPTSARTAEARYWEAFARYRRNRGDDLARAIDLLAAPGGGNPHPDAPALAARVIALRGDAPPPPPACTASNGTAFAEALASAAAGAGDRTAAERVAVQALSAGSCPVVGRRAAIALLGPSMSTIARYAVRGAAIGDPAPQVRSEAISMLAGDTGMGSLRLVAMILRRDTARIVALSAADVLSQLRHPETADTLTALVLDSMFIVPRQQALLSWSRFPNRVHPSIRDLQRAFPRLAHRGAMGATVLEFIAAVGDADDRGWIWEQVRDPSIPIMTRLTGLQQVGEERAVAELQALFSTNPPRLLMYGILKLLGSHRDPAATGALREIIAAQPPGTVRNAAQATLARRPAGQSP